MVDTGSVDRTTAIAHEFGAHVAEYPWTGDFSAARNTALGLATGDWILYIDADERFAVDGDLRMALDDPSAVAGLVRFRASQGFTPYLEYRLFRNVTIGAEYNSRRAPTPAPSFVLPSGNEVLRATHRLAVIVQLYADNFVAIRNAPVPGSVERDEDVVTVLRRKRRPFVEREP